MAGTRYPKRFGKYVLLDRIAAGGMAEVYRAKMVGMDQFQRLLAIKCMLPQLVSRDELQNGVIFEGVLDNFNGTALRLELSATPPQNFLWLNAASTASAPTGNAAEKWWSTVSGW